MLRRTRFTNLDGVENKNSFQDFRRWRKERKGKTKDLTENIQQAEQKEISFLKNNRSVPTLTWIGHSTFFLQFGGMNILTDPVWADSMGFEKRLTEPGIPLSDLPPIDVVIISHGHYDHLDFPTLKRLKGNPTYLIPVGLKPLFKKKGFAAVDEFVWWEQREVKGTRFTFVPAQHWTRRGLFDMNTSHWGGWVLENQTSKQTIYFAGDTGYFRGFNEIGQKFSIDYALLPIGAYEPEWFMKMSHINPEDSLKAFRELGAHYFIPMHYGTYRLADDTGPEALHRLLLEWEKQKLPNNQLMLLKLGETSKLLSV